MTPGLPLLLDLSNSLPPEARALILALQQQVHELQLRLGQNSTNSSRPPSTYPPAIKRRPRARSSLPITRRSQAHAAPSLRA